MDKQDVASNLARIDTLFTKGYYDEAVELLQKCINTSPLESKQFMEHLRDSTKDSEILDKLVHMYFLNFV